MADLNKVGKLMRTRYDNGQDVVAALRTQGKVAAVALDGVYGRTVAEWKTFFAGMADDQEAHDDALIGSEIALASERADDDGFRQARDDSRDDLFEEVVEFKDLCRTPTIQRKFSLDGETPQLPKDLASHVRAVIKSLREEDTTIDGPFGTSVATTDVADRLEPLVDDLAQRITDLKREEREADSLLVERDRKLDAWSRAYMSNARVAEGLFRRAGLDELADRIRPTGRKATGRERAEEPSTDADAPADTEPTDTEEPVGDDVS